MTLSKQLIDLKKEVSEMTESAKALNSVRIDIEELKGFSNKIESIETNIDNTNNIITRLSTDINTIDSKTKNTMIDINGIKKNLEQIQINFDTKISDITTNLKNLEKKIDYIIENVQKNIDIKIENITKTTKNLENKVEIIKNTSDENKFSDIKNEISPVNKQINETKNNVTNRNIPNIMDTKLNNFKKEFSKSNKNKEEKIVNNSKISKSKQGKSNSKKKIKQKEQVISKIDPTQTNSQIEKLNLDPSKFSRRHIIDTKEKKR